MGLEEQCNSRMQQSNLNKVSFTTGRQNYNIQTEVMNNGSIMTSQTSTQEVRIIVDNGKSPLL